MRKGELKTRIKRLETAMRKGQKFCPLCRLECRPRLPDPKKPRVRVEDIVSVKCMICQTVYLIGLDKLEPTEREITRLILSSTLEDLYTNPKVHAAVLWRAYAPCKIEDVSGQTSEEMHRTIEERAKKDRNARLYVELNSEVTKLFERKRKIFAVKYGGFPFPKHSLLIHSIQKRQKRSSDKSMYVPELFDLEMEETKHLIRAEMEKIIFGAARVETVSAIEDIGRRINEAIEAAVEWKRKRDEEQKRKEQEFLQRMNQGRSPVADKESGRILRAAPEEGQEDDVDEDDGAGLVMVHPTSKEEEGILKKRIERAMAQRNRIPPRNFPRR